MFFFYKNRYKTQDKYGQQIFFSPEGAKVIKVQTGQSVAQVPTDNPTFSVAWHPSKLLLAYTCDDKDKYHKDRDAGTVKLFGLLKE